MLSETHKDYKNKLYRLNKLTNNIAYNTNNNGKNKKGSGVIATKVMNLNTGGKSCQIILKIDCNESRKVELHSENCGKDRTGWSSWKRFIL